MVLMPLLHDLATGVQATGAQISIGQFHAHPKGNGPTPKIRRSLEWPWMQIRMQYHFLFLTLPGTVDKEAGAMTSVSKRIALGNTTHRARKGTTQLILNGHKKQSQWMGKIFCWWRHEHGRSVQLDRNGKEQLDPTQGCSTFPVRFLLLV